MKFAFSVIIRTTGKAGEKYVALLRSIAALDPRPAEVIVVLPEGTDPPAERIGEDTLTETFAYCPRGMVAQRLRGVELCRTPYALLTDDDIAFGPDFVRMLALPVVSGEYAFSSAPLFSFLPEKGLQTFLSALTGGAVPTVFHKDRYNTVLKTTGYSYNRNLVRGEGRLYETQSAPWTCFFADIAALRQIHFEDELWLDAHGYAAHDDTAMFFKGALCGKKTVIVADASYQHLDAKSSSAGNGRDRFYSSGYNTVVFWHRFIYKEACAGGGGLLAKACVRYSLLSTRFFNFLNVLRGRIGREEACAFREGSKAAWQFLRTPQYAAMPPVRRAG